MLRVCACEGYFVGKTESFERVTLYHVTLRVPPFIHLFISFFLFSSFGGAVDDGRWLVAYVFPMTKWADCVWYSIRVTTKRKAYYYGDYTMQFMPSKKLR